MKTYKEPIKTLWIWPVIAVISLATIPWLFTSGSYTLSLFGLPSWMLVSIGATIVLAIFMTYVINNFWDMKELIDEEESV